LLHIGVEILVTLWLASIAPYGAKAWFPVF